MIILQYGTFAVTTSHDDVKNAHDYVRYTINDVKIWVSATRSSYLPSKGYTSLLLKQHYEGKHPQLTYDGNEKFSTSMESVGKLKAMDIKIIELTTEIARLTKKV